MKITKTYTKTYNISAVREFGAYKDIIEARERIFGENGMKGLRSCFRCGHRFQDADMVHLAFNENGNNPFFCEDCARKFREQEE